MKMTPVSLGPNNHQQQRIWSPLSIYSTHFDILASGLVNSKTTKKETKSKQPKITCSEQKETKLKSSYQTPNFGKKNEKRD